jgi:hypothetical protein
MKLNDLQFLPVLMATEPNTPKTIPNPVVDILYDIYMNTQVQQRRVWFEITVTDFDL